MMSFYFNKIIKLINVTLILYEDKNNTHGLTETKSYNSFLKAKKR